MQRRRSSNAVRPYGTMGAMPPFIRGTSKCTPRLSCPVAPLGACRASHNNTRRQRYLLGLRWSSRRRSDSGGCFRAAAAAGSPCSGRTGSSSRACSSISCSSPAPSARCQHRSFVCKIHEFNSLSKLNTGVFLFFPFQEEVS